MDRQAQEAYCMEAQTERCIIASPGVPYEELSNQGNRSPGKDQKDFS